MGVNDLKQGPINNGNEIKLSLIDHVGVRRAHVTLLTNVHSRLRWPSTITSSVWTCLRASVQYPLCLSAASENSCPAPPKLIHTRIECLGGHGLKSECDVLCEPGYVRQGRTRVVCGENSEWETPFAACTGEFCPLHNTSCAVWHTSIKTNQKGRMKVSIR